VETRRRALPPGWYPASAAECRRDIEDFLRLSPPRPPELKCVSGGIVPHAGWFYSGKLAAWAFAAAAPERPQVVILFGGHLGRGEARVVLEDAWETPLGEVALARGLAEELKERLGAVREGVSGDNTIEIHLPILKFLFPESQLLALRVPHTDAALAAGREAAGLCRERNLSCVAFGSTDLTHYGPSYDFMPVGLGERALEWVRRVNDARFIEAALDLDAEALLRLGPWEGSACSAGAAAAAVAAARVLGASRGHLLGGFTSADVEASGDSFVGDSFVSDSFVGYAAVVF